MARRTGAAADEDITRDTELMLDDDDEGEPDANVFDAADLDGDEGEP